MVPITTLGSSYHRGTAGRHYSVQCRTQVLQHNCNRQFNQLGAEGPDEKDNDGAR